MEAFGDGEESRPDWAEGCTVSSNGPYFGEGANGNGAAEQSKGSERKEREKRARERSERKEQ